MGVQQRLGTDRETQKCDTTIKMAADDSVQSRIKKTGEKMDTNQGGRYTRKTKSQKSNETDFFRLATLIENQLAIIQEC